MEQKSSSDNLADVRDQQFKKWLQNKAIKDKAFNVSILSCLFAQL
jgi:hypothetical protein